jgi:hypothetical protein
MMEDNNNNKPFNLLAPQEKKKAPRHRKDPRVKQVIEYMAQGMSLMEAGLAVGFSEKHLRSQIYKPATGGQSPADFIKSQVAKRTASARSQAAVHTDVITGSLVEIMSASPADILPDHPILAKAKANGVDHLIKKIVITPVRVGTRSRKNANGSVTTSPVIRERIDLEMYSRLDAIAQLRDNFGMKSEPRANNYEETRRMEIERSVQDIMVAEKCDEATAAEILLANIGDAPHLVAEIKKILRRITKAKSEDGIH